MREGEVVGGRFEVERLAGAGGMATVYRARDRTTGEPVALKVLRGGHADLDRFEREVSLLASLDHPRVVRHVAHGIDPGAPWLAMEWLEGEALSDVVARGPLSIPDTLAVAQGVLEPLAEAHRRGIVHRDLKPGNVFLVGSRADGAKLLDFGIARGAADPRLTATGTALGTPAYMAPEQARSTRDVDPRADVFSAGCLLFECLVGRPAFDGETAIAVLAKILLEDPPPLRDLRAEVPPGLESVVARMIAKDRDRRPPDAAAVLEALRHGNERALRPVVSIAPPAALGRDEQRVLCVLFIASAGATDATLLPGEHRDLDAAMREAVGSRGGKIDLLANGAAIATFSDASAAEGATRAASAALALAASFGSTPIVLVTGRAVVAGRMPVGEVIDRGARALARGSAGPGTVRIDGATAGLLPPRFAVEGGGDDRVLRAESRAPELTRRLLGRPTSCVGRDRELGLLDLALAEAFDEPAARVVLITAPAGTGKSRVVHEALGRPSAARARVLLARADSVAAGSPFGIVADAVRHAAGWRDADTLASKHQKLAARLAPLVAAAEQRPLLEMLAELAGAPVPDGEASEVLRAARSDAVIMADALRSAFGDWIAAESGAAPVLLAIEDLHWGDLATVKLIDAALRRLHDRPWMVLATARPEVHTLFPELWSERGMQEIRLGVLSRSASERLVREVLGAEVPGGTVASIVERAAGNSFFLEELIRAVAEGGGGEGLPDTVLGTLQVRLDALGNDAKRVLRAASVFGETFGARGVAALLGEDGGSGLDHVLDVLVAREVIEPHGVSGRASDRELRFRHALVREAAYAMLTGDDRRLGHRLAAEWLEAAGERDAILLAEHFDRGAVPERAAVWYARAAEQALEGNDPAGAIDRAQRALGSGPDEGTRAELARLLAEAYYWAGDLSRAEVAARDAVAALPRGSASWFGALSTLMVCAGQVGDHERVAEWLALAASADPLPDAAAAHLGCLARGAGHLGWAHRLDALGVARPRVAALLAMGAAADPIAAGWHHRIRGEMALIERGDYDGCIAELEQSLAKFESAGAVRNAMLVSMLLGAVQAMGGERARAEARLDRVIGDCDRLALPYLAMIAEVVRAEASAFHGDAEGALAQLRELTPRVRGSARVAHGAHLVLSMALFDLGRFEEAEAEARQSFETTVTTHLLGYSRGALARVMVARGAAAEALPLAREAVAATAAEHDRFDGLGELALAEASLALGDLEGARAAARAAAARLESTASTMADPAVRAGFLARRHPNAQIRALLARVERHPLTE